MPTSENPKRALMRQDATHIAHIIDLNRPKLTRDELDVVEEKEAKVRQQTMGRIFDILRPLEIGLYASYKNYSSDDLLQKRPYLQIAFKEEDTRTYVSFKPQEMENPERKRGLLSFKREKEMGCKQVIICTGVQNEKDLLTREPLTLGMVENLKKHGITYDVAVVLMFDSKGRITSVSFTRDKSSRNEHNNDFEELGVIKGHVLEYFIDNNGVSVENRARYHSETFSYTVEGSSLSRVKSDGNRYPKGTIEDELDYIFGFIPTEELRFSDVQASSEESQNE